MHVVRLPSQWSSPVALAVFTSRDFPALEAVCRQVRFGESPLGLDLGTGIRSTLNGAWCKRPLRLLSTGACLLYDGRYRRCAALNSFYHDSANVLLCISLVRKHVSWANKDVRPAFVISITVNTDSFVLHAHTTVVYFAKVFQATIAQWPLHLEATAFVVFQRSILFQCCKTLKKHA